MTIGPPPLVIKNKQARERQFGKCPRGAEGKEGKLVSFVDDGGLPPSTDFCPLVRCIKGIVVQ